jgi:hypothetical protein
MAKYYEEDGDVGMATGVYLICDNGYICWPTTICPYMQSESGGTRLEDLFSTNLESVRKDVECVFGILKSRWGCLDRGFKHRKMGILKSRWGCLDRGFKHRKMKVCGDIFRTCAVLHNMMLTEMVSEGQPSRLRQATSIKKWD